MSALVDGSSDRSDKRLESWKQIAAHLNRHVTTVRRWEKYEGLPVHRHIHSALSSIYAYTSELAAWVESRQPEEPLGGRVAELTLAHTADRRHITTPPWLGFVDASPVALLGRNEEMDLLGRTLSAASSGQQSVVLITGEAGQGKTRLAVEFARSVAAQATVLTGAWHRESLLPFAPFVTMLQWLVRTGDTQALRMTLNEITGSGELAQLAPELAKSILPLTPNLHSTTDGRRFQMFDAFAQLLAALSRRSPLLLLFEDAHWADAGSLLFLNHLIRSTRTESICILITCRENEPGCVAFSEEVLQEFQREFAATRICLGGLDREYVERFMDSWTNLSATPQHIEWMTSCSEGNPLYMTEMLKSLGESNGFSGKLPADPHPRLSLPEGIRHLIRRRLACLSPASTKVLTFAAVIGRDFSLPLIEVLTDLAEDGILDAIQEAVNAKIVSETPGAPERFSFTHSLIRETLYADVLAARRVRLHHRVGQALEQQSTPETLPIEELAYHFTQGAVYDLEKAIEYAVRAGGHALCRLALEDSARYYAMALSSLDLLPNLTSAINNRRIELHALRGRSLFQAGQWAAATTEFEASLSLLGPTEAVKRCELLVNLAEAAFWLMDVSALRRSAKEAEVLAAQIGRNDLWADARAWMASAQVADGDVRGGIITDRQTLTKGGEINSFALARIPLTLYWAGHTAEAACRAQQAVEGARTSGEPAFLLYALQHLGICLSGAGRYDEALKAFDEACTYGRQCGASSLLARAVSMSVAPLLSLGEFARAARRAMEARELARRVAFEPTLVSAGIDLLLIHARTQDPGSTEALLAEGQRAVDGANGWHAWKWRMRLCEARAELALAKGDWTEAITFASETVKQASNRHRPKYQAMALMVRACARQELGLVTAVTDARAAVQIARQLSDPVMLAECLSVLLLQQGSDELLAESRQAVAKVHLGVTDESLRTSFLAKLRANGERQQNRMLHAVS